MVPQIKAVVGTPSGDEAKLKASEAGVFARKMDFVQANALLDQAETALNASEGAAATVSTESDNSLADQFRNRLTALVPQIKAVVGTPSGDEAKLKASEAGVFARKMDFVQANALLDQAETALNASEGAAATVSTESDNSLADQFRNRLTALVPQIKAVVGTPSGDEAKLKASEAGVFARKMDFVQANALLDQAETALKTPVSKSAESTNDESTAAGVEVDQPANLDEALAGWKVAQNKMAVKLRMVEKALSAADHPDVMNALLELKAVRSQLSGTPDTMQKVREIEKYLHQDEIVEDVCELADDIRTPLLAATAQLKSVL